MLFMNDYDIAMAAQLCAPGDAVKLRAVRTLEAFVESVNSQSDGWAHWGAAPQAARKLMELIQGPPNPSESDYRKALSPIKALYSRHNLKNRPECLT